MIRFIQSLSLVTLLGTSCLFLAGCDASANTIVEPMEGPDPSQIDELSYEEEMKRQVNEVR